MKHIVYWPYVSILVTTVGEGGDPARIYQLFLLLGDQLAFCEKEGVWDTALGIYRLVI